MIQLGVCKDFDLIGNILHDAQNKVVAFNKSKRVEWELMLFGKLFYQWLDFAQIVARDAREQMVFNLKLWSHKDYLQSTMEPI